MNRKLLILTLASFCSVAFAAEPPKLKPGLYAIFNTSEGTFQAILYEKDVPIAVKTFVGLAQGTQPWLDPNTKTAVRRPLYQNLMFHRVLPEVMIQSGDPTGTGKHNCGIRIRDEFLPGLQFSSAGKLAMANTGEDNSGGCQFFVTSQPMPQWNEKYTIFGQVVRGQNVVDTINKQPVKDDRPVHPATLNNVSIVRISPIKNPENPTKR
jgi:peptidyl-prolyl cis-trans isomerase A (cyclophilin A)